MSDTGQLSEGLALPYTRTGDDGTTTLGDLSRVSKDDSRVAAYAACEEANAAIGVVVAAASGVSLRVSMLLSRVQHDLLEVQGDISTPMSKGAADQQTRIEQDYITRVEEACEHYSAGLPAVETFVLPGGTETAALLYQAATLVRRAERDTWRAREEHRDVNVFTGRYLNRLSSLLFVLGRASNAEHGDSTWEPGLTARVGLLPPEPGGESEANAGA